MGALSNGYGTYFLKYALSNALLHGVALRHSLAANKIILSPIGQWADRVMMD